MQLSKPVSEIDPILPFWLSIHQLEYEQLPPITVWAVCFHCELRPPRGHAEKSVCNHGACEPTPRVNEKVSLTHVNTVSNLAALRRLLWWMSLTYSMSREPHGRTKRPYCHHLHHHCCWGTFTHEQQPTRQVSGVFISVFLLNFGFWICWRSYRPWSGPPPTHPPTHTLFLVLPLFSCILNIQICWISFPSGAEQCFMKGAHWLIDGRIEPEG